MYVRKDGVERAGRMPPAERKAMLLRHAVDIARSRGLDDVTRVTVAEAAGVTHGLVNRYFEGLPGLRNAVKRAMRKGGV